jgi:hypothetical protein
MRILDVVVDEVVDEAIVVDGVVVMDEVVEAARLTNGFSFIGRLFALSDWLEWLDHYFFWPASND